MIPPADQDADEDLPLSREEIAGAWCVRLATGRAGPADQAEFARWLTQEPDNLPAFEQAMGVWEGLDRVGDSEQVMALRAEARNAMRRARHGSLHQRFHQCLHQQWHRALAVAASLLLLFATAYWISLPDQRYATDVGERRTVFLADGSRLSLDAATRVDVNYDDSRRALTLHAGRAKFDVAHDPLRPFSVTAGGRTVVATGTAFSVELLQQEMRVILYEGHVAVVEGQRAPAEAAAKTAPPQVVRLAAPGRELVAARQGAARVLPTDPVRSLSWEAGQLSFADEPLERVAERLNRYSEEKIVVTHADVAAIQINGVFNAGDTAGFLEALATAYPVLVRREEGRAIVSSRKDEAS